MSTEMYESNLERQIDELSTLQSICGEEEFNYNTSETEPVGHSEINILLNLPMQIKYNDSKSIEVCTMFVNFLPPLNMYFQMPIQYPSTRAPRFTLSCAWLSRKHLSVLCTKLDEIWKENLGTEILFTWIQFIKDDALDYLKLICLDITAKGSEMTDYKNVPIEGYFDVTPIEPDVNQQSEDDYSYEKIRKSSNNINAICMLDARAINVETSKPLIILLKEHDHKCLEEEFDKSSVFCEICFDSKSGAHSCKINTCGHAFCKLCVNEYLVTKIKDGNVKSICCPSNKCESEVSIAIIKALVTPDIFITYENMLLTQTLDTMMDIIYCPLIFCQYPVTYNPNEVVAQCPNCNYSFCIYCKKVYHGVELCKLDENERFNVIKEYTDGTEEYRKRINKKYGESYIKRLIDEHESQKLIKALTKPCPKCQVHIEKSEGCNKMTCNRCNTFFCWICSKILNKCNPYDHFSNPMSPCFKKLFPNPEDYNEYEWDGGFNAELI